MSETVSYYENAKEIEKKIWDLLSKAVKDRSSEFRLQFLFVEMIKILMVGLLFLERQINKIILFSIIAILGRQKLKKLKKILSALFYFMVKKKKYSLELRLSAK